MIILEIRNMEKTLANYENKINKINKQYNNSIKYHQREINKLKNDMENNINITHQNRMNEGTFNINSYEDMENESDQRKSVNDDLLHSLKITIPSKEGIRNEYINSQVQKIKNSEHNYNNINIYNNKE